MEMAQKVGGGGPPGHYGVAGPAFKWVNDIKQERLYVGAVHSYSCVYYVKTYHDIELYQKKYTTYMAILKSYGTNDLSTLNWEENNRSSLLPTVRR